MISTSCKAASLSLGYSAIKGTSQLRRTGRGLACTAFSWPGALGSFWIEVEAARLSVGGWVGAFWPFRVAMGSSVRWLASAGLRWASRLLRATNELLPQLARYFTSKLSANQPARLYQVLGLGSLWFSLLSNLPVCWLRMAATEFRSFQSGRRKTKVLRERNTNGWTKRDPEMKRSRDLKLLIL